MIRSAAKNHAHVVVVTEPAQLAEVEAEITAQGGTSLALRRRFAAAAYARTAAYDAAIGGWFAGQLGQDFPPRLAFAGVLKQTLRYGENPHQAAGFYLDGTARRGIATATQVQGKELSYNNLNDTDAAFEACAEFAAPAIVIVKHANPCGVAVAADLASAWDRRCSATRSRPSAASSRRTGCWMRRRRRRSRRSSPRWWWRPMPMTAAQAVFARKKNLRLLLTGGMPDPAAPGLTFRSVAGGFLAQSRDAGRVAEADLRVVTKRAPTPAEMADLIFAFRVCKHVKSNAIVYAKGLATVGIGAGQMNRVESSRIAAWKSEAAARAAGLAEPLAKGSVVASDAFFPFADGLETAAAAGATAVIQPGGSIRDAEVIAAADAAGLAMVFTGMRHFRH